MDEKGRKRYPVVTVTGVGSKGPWSKVGIISQEKG